MQIIKRDGSKVDFDKSKIENAILKAMKYGSGIVDTEIAKTIADGSEIKFKEDYNDTPTIHQVEDYVYFSLLEYEQDLTAKAYEGYRAVQSFKRHMNTTDDSIMGLISYTNKEVINENSNKNSYIASTQRDCATCCNMKSIA